jgi:DNA repair exonuclease SbcCD ATPase subunit
VNTDIELVSKALAEFDAVGAGLQALREKYAGVVFDVTTTQGMDDAKEARRALREPRYEVERIRKEAKAPILALGKKLDEDAKRITAEIEKLEGPIDQQIKHEEARKAREREARAAAEAARVKGIQDRIAEIRGVVSVRCSDAANILEHIGDIERIEIDDTFGEFQDTAADAKAASLARLRDMHAAVVAQEAEAARIAAEREELARLRAEQAEREAAERARLAEEERVAREAREAAEREAQAKRAAEEAELARQRDELARQQREQAERLAAEEARLASERAEIARQQEELRKAQEPPPAPVKAAPRKRPSDADIIKAVAAAFSVSAEVAAGWLADMKAAA